MKILILQEGDKVAKDYGFGASISALFKGLDKLKISYTLNPDDDFDVIVANDFLNSDKGIELKNKTGKSLIASFHLAQGNMKEEHDLIEASDGIIVYSEASKECLTRMYPHSLKKPIEKVQLGIDTDFWTLQEEEKDGKMFFTGRTKAHNKNFLEIMRKVTEEQIPFKVAGDNDDIPGYSIGYLNKEELRKEYAKSHVHIMPSTFEPFGQVSLEAMASGCPVAVSTRAGVSEYLNNNVAIFFDPLSPFSLTEIMNLASGFDRKKISDYARQFTVEAYAKDFFETVSRLTHYSNVLKEIDTGIYDAFDVTGIDVVDIGAYMGETALHFLKKGARKVYAVEPFESFNYIPKQDNIEAIRKCVSKHKVPYFFVANGYKNNGESCVSTHTVNMGNCTLVPVLDLATIDVRDALLKVDCEGDEDFILELDLLTLNKYKFVIVEAHDFIKPGIQYKIAAHLSTCGFDVRLQKRTPTETMIYANKL